MKLASLRDGSRDGKLAVVSRDLTRCTDASFLVPTLQAALDDWARLSPHLMALAESLEHGAVPAQRFHEHDALSPLPRAYQFLDGSAYLPHVVTMRRARGQPVPEQAKTVPMMYQGGSDAFLAPREPIRFPDERWAIDLEGEVAVILDDVPMGAPADQGRGAIRLLMLANDVSLRALAAAELDTGFGFVHAKPPTAFSPVAVTPDELEDAWDGDRLHLPLLASVSGRPLGRADAGVDMHFGFGDLIAHAARTRPLRAGTIVGSGTVSNGYEDGMGKAIDGGGAGFSCLAEARMAEKLSTGSSTTGFLRVGDTVRIEMKDRRGHSVFGAIEQTVESISEEGKP